MRLFGLCLIFTSFLVPLYWSIELANQYESIAVFSQYAGILALIAMAWTQLLATRIKGLEMAFGGLDRIYVLHKWLGISAVVFVFLHDQFDSEINGLPETWLSDLAESLGGTGWDFLWILVIITLITIIPYRLWFFSHKFMGLLYVLSSLHFLWIPKPYSMTEPMGLYVGTFCVIGILSYLYLLLPVRSHTKYKVAAIEHYQQAYSILLEPVKKGIKHKAGQFAFLRFKQAPVAQTHPFTISQNADANGNLRFSIKELGVYTQTLKDHVQVGSLVHVDGPYGHFTLADKKAEQIWVAAGIGITPFIACAQALAKDVQHTVHLFYCVPNKADAVHLEELELLAKTNKAFKLHLIESAVSGRLTVEKIAELTQADWKKVHIAFCGPAAMRKHLMRGFKKLGVSLTRFHYEEFEIRSDIGLTPYVIKAFETLKKFMPFKRVDFLDKGLKTLYGFVLKLLNRLPAWLQ